MKIKSKNIIGSLVLAISVLAGYSFSSAQSVYIVPNSNNQYFFANSAYGRNYYAYNQNYNYNYNSPCYGLKACYSLNYLKLANNYPSYNNPHYNYNNSNVNYTNTYLYGSYNNYYLND